MQPERFIASLAAPALMAAALVLGAPATATARPVLDGTWAMKFRTISNIGFNNPKPGSQRTREWIFERSKGRIRVYRETTSGYVRLPVHRTGPVYKVKWRTRATCSNGHGSFPYSETITFTVRRSVVRDGQELASRVAGRLIGRSPADTCGKDTPASVAKDRMTGHRTDLPDGSEAAAASAGYKDCWIVGSPNLADLKAKRISCRMARGVYHKSLRVAMRDPDANPTRFGYRGRWWTCRAKNPHREINGQYVHYRWKCQAGGGRVSRYRWLAGE